MKQKVSIYDVWNEIGQARSGQVMTSGTRGPNGLRAIFTSLIFPLLFRSSLDILEQVENAGMDDGSGRGLHNIKPCWNGNQSEA